MYFITTDHRKPIFVTQFLNFKKFELEVVLPGFAYRVVSKIEVEAVHPDEFLNNYHKDAPSCKSLETLSVLSSFGQLEVAEVLIVFINTQHRVLNHWSSSLIFPSSYWPKIVGATVWGGLMKVKHCLHNNKLGLKFPTQGNFELTSPWRSQKFL